MESHSGNCLVQVPWNKGPLVGQKAPLKLTEIWAIRIRLQLAGKVRDLALFNLAIDSKLRGCDLVSLRVCVTCRDVAHRRLIEQGRELPVNLEGGAIFHAGPIVRKKDDGGFEMVSIGPTTSLRMEKFEHEFISKRDFSLSITHNFGSRRARLCASRRLESKAMPMRWDDDEAYSAVSLSR